MVLKPTSNRALVNCLPYHQRVKSSCSLLCLGRYHRESQRLSDTLPFKGSSLFQSKHRRLRVAFQMLRMAIPQSILLGTQVTATAQLRQRGKSLKHSTPFLNTLPQTGVLTLCCHTSTTWSRLGLFKRDLSSFTSPLTLP